MKKISLLLFLVIPSFSFAQNGYLLSGAGAAGMANAAITRQDVWSLFHNPAGVAFIKTTQTGISYEKRFSLKELSTNGFGIAVPVSNGALGINAAYYGYKNYNEKHAGLTYSRKFSEKIGAGIKLVYHTVKIGSEYGNKSILTADLGLQANVARNLWLGTHIYNPIQAELVSETGEQLPSIFNIGAGYLFSDKFRIEIMGEKPSTEKALVRTGIEYHPIKQLWLRAGIASQPMSSSFGFGLDLSSLRMDFAASFHPQLGFTPNIGLTYLFPEKSK